MLRLQRMYETLSFLIGVHKLYSLFDAESILKKHAERV